MKKAICAVKDKKIGLFDQPFSVRHPGEAIREWDSLIKNPQTKFGMNPDDFDLYQIAVYDEELGSFENLNPHLQLSSGIQ